MDLSLKAIVSSLLMIWICLPKKNMVHSLRFNYYVNFWIRVGGMNIKIRRNLLRRLLILFWWQRWDHLEEDVLLLLPVSWGIFHWLPLHHLRIKLWIVSSQLFLSGSLVLLTSMPTSWRLSQKYSMLLLKSTKMPLSNSYLLLPNRIIYSICEISPESSLVFACRTNKSFKAKTKPAEYGCIKSWECFLIVWLMSRIG